MENSKEQELCVTSFSGRINGLVDEAVPETKLTSYTLNAFDMHAAFSENI